MEKIYIYGAGNMGKAAAELLKNKCKILAFLDRNENLDGTFIIDIPVYTPNHVPDLESVKDSIVLVAMTACPFLEVKNYLMRLGFNAVISVGDYVSRFYAGLVNVWKCNDLNRDILDIFSDEESKKEFLVACDWFEGNVEGELTLECVDRKKYFPDFLMQAISRCQVMLDTASLEGEYLKNFLNISSDRKAYAYILTPSSISLSNLKERLNDKDVVFFEKEAADQNGKVYYQRIGLMNPFTTSEGYIVQVEKIDQTMHNIKYDYMRCYSMSEVFPILQGGMQTIREYRPMISVNIGHYESDFKIVPTYLKSMMEGYLFYFRLHSFQGNDCILYAVPEERINL